MKEYNMKAIVDKDELKLIFECDKEKNKKCKGYGNCRECNHTSDTRYMKSKDIKKIFDKQLEIKINDEDYIIKYNKDTDAIILNAYLIKLVKEQNINRIYKYNEFKIINRTRFEKQEKFFEYLF